MAQTYDPTLVSLTYVVPGVAVVDFQQFADGTFISLERDGNAYDDSAGGGGHVVRVRNPDRRATLSVTLMAEAPENDLLSAIAFADRVAGAGVGHIQLSYLDGTTICIAPECWIIKEPRLDYAKDLSPREWSFKMAECDIFVGGV